MFAGEGKMELDRQIGAAAAVMLALYQAVEVKRSLSLKAKLSIVWNSLLSLLPPRSGHR